MANQAPCPPSPVIRKVHWAPLQEIRRYARGRQRENGTWDGSDNWPLAWANDGHLYTAYGDGFGFDPPVPTKLGMGFARIRGGPLDLQAENIRSSGENTGIGKSGAKASGRRIRCL